MGVVSIGVLLVVVGEGEFVFYQFLQEAAYCFIV